MIVTSWEKLPKKLQVDEIKEYYEYLRKKRLSLIIKRIFDIIASLILIILLAIPMGIIAVWIKRDSEGKVFYRQVRVTQYGKEFRVFKFRTMVSNADKIGAQVTTDGDSRITKVGAKLRDKRLDELPQLFNVLAGEMTFIGVRPEVPKYVGAYTDEMKATLLLPAGISSMASIEFKDEDELMKGADDVDKAYIEKVLPAKMAHNLQDIKKFSLGYDIKTMLKTVKVVLS